MRCLNIFLCVFSFPATSLRKVTSSSFPLMLSGSKSKSSLFLAIADVIICLFMLRLLAYDVMLSPDSVLLSSSMLAMVESNPAGMSCLWSMTNGLTLYASLFIKWVESLIEWVNRKLLTTLGFKNESMSYEKAIIRLGLTEPDFKA